MPFLCRYRFTVITSLLELLTVLLKNTLASLVCLSYTTNTKNFTQSKLWRDCLCNQIFIFTPNNSLSKNKTNPKAFLKFFLFSYGAPRKN